MSQVIQALLHELKAELSALYGAHLKGLYLYGSYARGEADSESDVDVLLVLDEVPHYAAEVDRTSLLIGQLSLKYRLCISRVFVSERDWRNRDSSFLTAVREDAVLA